MADKLVAVIDAGTTNVKILVFDSSCKVVEHMTRPLTKNHPNPGWAEQDPQELVDITHETLDQIIDKHPAINAIGITNQRETIVMWDKRDGKALYPAILWEDTRTQQICERMNQDNELVVKIRERTGLSISPYFSATKMQWLLKNTYLKPDDLDHIKFGTIDSWLIYKLTGEHVTDYTNASRTLLFNIKSLRWDPELLDLFAIPQNTLPTVLPSKSQFGICQEHNIPICAVMGDQQASLYAAGVDMGTVKVTYGTGIFPMKIIGQEFELEEGLLTTLAVGYNNTPLYALEGKVDNASARTTPVLDNPSQLSRVVRELAAETAPLLEKLIDSNTSQIFVDGGISQNDTLLVEQKRLNGIPMKRLSIYEGTALGVAKLLLSQ